MTHSFDVGLAEKYGIIEAILLSHLVFWIKKNKVNDKHLYEKNYWTYCSVKGFKEYFPYLTERQIGYSLKNLEDKNIIKSGNFNKIGYDRTKWYCIIDKCILQENKIEFTNLSNGINKIVEPIPDINTDNKTDIDTHAPENPIEEKKEGFDFVQIIRKWNSFKTLIPENEMTFLNSHKLRWLYPILKPYSMPDILEAITNYDICLRSPKLYWFDSRQDIYTWIKNNFTKFLEANDPERTFARSKK